MATNLAVFGGSSVAVAVSVSALCSRRRAQYLGHRSPAARIVKVSRFTTNSGNASEDVDSDVDTDLDYRDGEDLLSSSNLHRQRQRRREQDIEVDGDEMEEGDGDEAEGKGVVSIRPMLTVRWEEQQQHEHPVQKVIGKGVWYNHLCDNRDVFQANNGIMVLRPLLGMRTDTR